MYRHVVPETLVAAIKRSRRLHRAARKARFTVGRLLPPREFDGIPGRIHPNDFMFENASADEIASYAERARNVMSNIEASLGAGGRTFEDVDRWLDFGCGYGRVIRFLVERVPPERVFASDVVREGVDFCSDEFGVHSVYSRTELEALELGTFDFIYAISVLTHLNERNSLAMLRLLGESLADGGIAMFTTHGRTSLENAGLYGAEFAARKDEIVRAVEERGMTFLPYPFTGSDDYGMAWHARDWIETKMTELHSHRMKRLLFTPRGLDGHQDVFAFQRVA
jgi:SAM-dependent methyltransferase